MSNHLIDSPAFPHHDFGQGRPFQPGLSMRDYFAAAALQGLLAGDAKNGTWGEYATMAYNLADQMLKRKELP